LRCPSSPLLLFSTPETVTGTPENRGRPTAVTRVSMKRPPLDAPQTSLIVRIRHLPRGLDTTAKNGQDRPLDSQSVHRLRAVGTLPPPGTHDARYQPRRTADEVI
jgi:hypothetical protein